MGKENKSYRIRTNVDQDSYVTFNIDNSVDTYDILSLNINQASTYKLMGSGTGIIAGRVLANGGFGVPNVKVSVFIQYEDTESVEKRILYHFNSTKDTDDNKVRYNLLPDKVDDECHQNIGTFVSKRVLLDNNTWIDIFDKYYSLTTRTNNSGDYMIYGVPTGMQTVHMDVDLSDIGILSQRPRDLIYKGYDANMFESPNKFKTDTNIDSLAQVITQDKTIYVYPFWGDTSDSNLNASITRCDMNVNYKFEPTCVFMGSIISDTGENAMSKKCIGAKRQGRMSEMITGEGKIEMIRKTPNGQVEQFSVNGDKNINGDGVWCYQIPMNLDYVKTDEFGNLVMSDNPSTGIATRARVRFRLSMAETPSDATARKRARFLIPNNPRLVESDYPNFCENKEIDYEFGTKTKDENFRDLMWNNVYTVKSYIPRIQKSKLPNSMKHLGIKMVNHSGGNNPMPFNNLRIKFNFVYMFLCTLVKVLTRIVGVINGLLTFIGWIFYSVGKIFFNISRDIPFHVLKELVLNNIAKLFAIYNGKSMYELKKDGFSATDFVAAVNDDMKNKTAKTGGVAAWFMKIFIKIGCGIQLSGLCETDDGVEINVTPGTYDKTKKVLKEAGIESCNDRVDELFNCIENQLAQDNEVTSFNFYNDWINGVVYLPLWYRKIRVRRKGKKVKDEWCNTDNTILVNRKYKKNIRLYATNVQRRTVTKQTSTTMGTIKPLVDNSDTVTTYANNETGVETIVFKKKNDENCYGYQCHKYARTHFKIYKGLIYEKETMLGDKVYYYKPCNYDTSTGVSDLVTLFATDIVLLGSLNSCDIHGVPQFFKCLESTTYNMPPDLLVEGYDYKSEDDQSTVDEDDANQIDLATRMTEYTGADWGNLGADQSNLKGKLLSFAGNSWYADANENEWDNGGLFYGLTCFDSYTKPKSNINLSRICELGVSLDENTEIPRDSGEGSDIDGDTDTLTPDGFISYDDVYNPDYRSMFATLNSNWLKTKINVQTGLPEYDFNHLYIDNFDGSLKNLMMAKTVRGTTEKSDFTKQANYVGNYNLEESSDAYLRFRYGDYTKQNGKKIYYYDNTNNVGAAAIGNPIKGADRLPRYENSFYFYFGLNEGKTAIDKFNTEFFSSCGNNIAQGIPYDMAYRGNSWCPPIAQDGFIAFNVNVETPLAIKFTDKETLDVYTCDNIKDQKFIFYDINATSGIPEEYHNYKKYELNKVAANGIDGVTSAVQILDTGTYSIEMTDNYENTYEDNITFELPRIGFVCDVNPFNCKNAELKIRFAGADNAATYTNIASYGSIVGNRLERDIYGFIAISEVTESDYRIDLTPVNTSFFDGDYSGVSIVVHNGQSTLIGGPGHIGDTVVDNVTTHYFGVPYGGQRYKLKVTQLCSGDVYSDNSTELVVTVYEDEFKLYINGVDYDLINRFRTGWNDGILTENGEFKINAVNGAVGFDPSAMVGWNNILNIGGFTTIQYNTALGEVVNTVNGLKYDPDTVVGNTPYDWTEEYCYDNSEGLININSNLGTVQVSSTEYSIASDVDLYDTPSHQIQASDIQDGVTYYTDSDCTVNAVVGFDYYKETIYTTEDVVREDIITEIGDERIYSANYVLVANNSVGVAVEDRDGIITYTAEPGTESIYSGLECLSFNEYRGLVDDVNTTIDSRLDVARQVAGNFRINEDETQLNISASTKAMPVKYLMMGSNETLLYTKTQKYRPTDNVPLVITKQEIRESAKKHSIDNNYELVHEAQHVVEKGYVVDKFFETTTVTFTLPTLTHNGVNGTYGEYRDTKNTPKHPYYVSILNDNNAALPLTEDLTNFNTTIGTKNINTTFGVHFYNKPLKGEFPVIFSYINDTPAYPEYINGVLGEDVICADVSMPGFMCGYLYNGTPGTEPEATLDDKEISLYTVNDDTFENIETKRLMYTVYNTVLGIQPTYGTHKIYNTTEGSLQCQYVEIPLSEAELVYTDGYGDSYVKTIDGTFNLTIDNPVFSYRVKSVSDDNLRYPLRHDYLRFLTSTPDYQSVYYVFDCDNTEYPLKYGEHSNLKYNSVLGTYYFSQMPSIMNDLENSGYISKSKSIAYDVTKYLCEKKYADGNHNMNITCPMDKFFAIGACNGVYTLSPVVEIQPFRLVRGYFFHERYENFNEVLPDGTKYYIYVGENPSDPNNVRGFVSNTTVGDMTVETVMNSVNGRAIYKQARNPFNTNGGLDYFSNIEGDYVYLTAQFSHDISDISSAMDGIHYIEDFFYMLYYRFKLQFRIYDESLDDFTTAIYNQICSLAEGTAELCYIKVDDQYGYEVSGGQYKPVVYWATAIRLELSALGQEIPDWYAAFVEDKSGIVRSAVGQWAVPKGPNGKWSPTDYKDRMVVVEFNSKDEMMEDYENYNQSNS